MTYFIGKLRIVIAVLLLTEVGFAFGSTSEECEEACSSSSCCGRGFINADFLYWRVNQGGACGCNPDEINNFINTDGNVRSKFKGHTKDSHFKWNPGFRIGIGYEFISQNWDIAAYWTHFNTHIHNQHQLNQFRGKLNYDVIDVLAGRNFYLDSFIIRPFIGVRTALIEQKVKSSSSMAYNTFFTTSTVSSFSPNSYENFTSPSTSDFLISKENNKEKFRGVGPLIGIEADWNLGCGFSLYACASVSSLYGYFNNSSKEFNTFLNGTNACEKKAHLHSCQISTDALLGIRWEQCFCDNMQLLLQLTLEQHCYFDQNHSSDYDNLWLDGVSFSGGISF